MNKFNKGDFVFVIDWGKQYSKIGGGNGVFFDCPDYSSPCFFWEVIKENTSKSQLRRYEKVISRTPVWKNFKYEVIDFIEHPNGDGIIYLLASQNVNTWDRCYVEIGELGLYRLTPEQYKDKEFNALREANLKKWKISDNTELFPKELLKYMYDSNQNTLFGANVIKATIRYPYIPKEYTVLGNNICLGWEQVFDGGSSFDKQLSVNWTDLKRLFPENTFRG